MLWGDGDLHVATNWKRFLGWSARLDGDGGGRRGGGLCEGRNSNKTGKSLLLGEQSLIMIQENTAFLSSQ